MLAKPEYFSPPDEVCCWPRRCGGAVAGLGAVAELLLAWALWRRAIGNQLLPRRRGGTVAGREPLAQRTACRSSEAELHREELAAPQKTMRLHREANKRTQKEKGPEETLISLSGHSYLLLRKLTAADPANDACELTRWRSCRCNYAGIARKVAANARIA